MSTPSVRWRASGYPGVTGTRCRHIAISRNFGWRDKKGATSGRLYGCNIAGISGGTDFGSVAQLPHYPLISVSSGVAASIMRLS